MKKPALLNNKEWDLRVKYMNGHIYVTEEGDELGHPLGDVTDDCLWATILKGADEADKLNSYYVKCHIGNYNWYIVVKKDIPRYKKIIYFFKRRLG